MGRDGPVTLPQAFPSQRCSLPSLPLLDREALGRRATLRIIELGDVLQTQADDGRIPCLRGLLRRVVQAEDPVVTAEAERARYRPVRPTACTPR